MTKQNLFAAYITPSCATSHMKAGELIPTRNPKSNVKALLASRRYGVVSSQLTSPGSLGDVVLNRRSWQYIYTINAPLKNANSFNSSINQSGDMNVSIQYNRNR